MLMFSPFRGWARLAAAAIALLLATAIWLPVVHLFFRPTLADYRQSHGIAPAARQIAHRHLRLWEDPALRAAEIDRMRASNAEWDFMGRTFLVLGLANIALHEPHEQARYLTVIDQIIDETLKVEAEHGMYFFLMPYARAGPFVAQPARSLFIDGEIALMLAARQRVAINPRYERPLAQRIDTIVQGMQSGPALCAESYPDECWMFCNAAAVAAVAVSDSVDGRDHGAFINEWLASIKARLVDHETGLLVSSFTYDGKPLDGPEGSSIWFVAHCLQLIDPDFAADQYARARAELGQRIMGFGYAREWPASWQGPMDVDSGPIVPVLGASAGSSGLALLGAAAFDDHNFLRELLTSLQFAGFPCTDDHGRSYAAGNQVGDAVLLYALVQGPLWQQVLTPSPF
ncbi:MAG: hypothetical protein WD042_06890 [Phycisphaeraceae bacterium]